MQAAPLLTPAAKGTYSRLFDLGALTDIDSVTINGLATNRGSVSLQYRLAPSSAVLGATVDKGVIPLGSPVSFGGAAARYLWLKLVLDDTDAAAINPDAANERDITDIVVSYGSPLNLRLGCSCGPGDGHPLLELTWLLLPLGALRRRRTQR